GLVGEGPLGRLAEPAQRAFENPVLCHCCLRGHATAEPAAYDRFSHGAMATPPPWGRRRAWHGKLAGFLAARPTCCPASRSARGPSPGAHAASAAPCWRAP